MIKKIGFLLVFIIVIWYGYGYIYNQSRLNNILPNVLGEDNKKYITQIDKDISIGGPVSIETYIFKILDTEKINCNNFNGVIMSKEALIHFDKKYINAEEEYCTKYLNDDSNRTLKLLIQDDTFVLNIFMD